MKNLPPLPSRKGVSGALRFPPDGVIHRFTVLDEIRRTQSGAPEKIICLERIRFDDDGRQEIRLGYYIIGKRPRMRGKWVWGQFATFMPKKDFAFIVAEARKRGWLS